ncbi:MAG: hypothetical protein QE493_01490 [Verrucomicrobiae bacterium]|nr:hypothetical protein [Verrucomicrobiae bacterium]
MTIQYEISGLTRIFHTKSITACGKLLITALISKSCPISLHGRLVTISIKYLG